MCVKSGVSLWGCASHSPHPARTCVFFVFLVVMFVYTYMCLHVPRREGEGKGGVYHKREDSPMWGEAHKKERPPIHTGMHHSTLKKAKACTKQDAASDIHVPLPQSKGRGEEAETAKKRSAAPRRAYASRGLNSHIGRDSAESAHEVLSRDSGTAQRC